MRTSVSVTELPARRLRLLAAAGAVALMAASLVTGAARAQDGEVSVSTRTGDLGTYLVDAAGATLYYFEPDGAGAFVCSGDCLAA